ncbi:MAG TPA: hypothetical protein VIL16_13840 [Trebonia sp.]
MTLTDIYLATGSLTPRPPAVQPCPPRFCGGAQRRHQRRSIAENVGTDPGTGNTLILRTPYIGGDYQLDVISAHGTTVADTPLSDLTGLDRGNSHLESATLDTQRDKAYAEVYDAVNGLSLLYAVSMVSGAVTATTTGTQGPCLDGVAYLMVKIDPVAGTASPDPVHNVLVEASIFEANFLTDNNAMSEITVINPTTGAVLNRLPIANLIDRTEEGVNFDFTTHQGLYLDPATRTGYLADASDTGIERFTY